MKGKHERPAQQRQISAEQSPPKNVGKSIVAAADTAGVKNGKERKRTPPSSGQATGVFAGVDGGGVGVGGEGGPFYTES